MSERATMLRPVLVHLARSRPVAPELWQDWGLSRVVGGANNLLYRVTGDAGDFAVKFCIRDSRDRAGREYNALCVLAQAGLSIAPEPVLLDQQSYPAPLVVQSWLPGEVLKAPPATDQAWHSLVAHFAAIHTVTPAMTNTILPVAVLNARSREACRELIQQQIELLPPEAQPGELHTLVCRLEGLLGQDWPAVPPSLCRVDPNCSNFVRRAGAWASVDWENSGWGDPAFEIADLMVHPAYIGVPASRWDWMLDRYCSLVRDPGAPERVRVYRKTMMVWWVARLARTLHEVPRGLDPRLVDRPANWEHDARSKYQHYLCVAQSII